MDWIRAFHIIVMVCWFAGIFYLPRLFVYHAESSDTISIERFKVMERRLYYGISTPSAILTTLFGLWLLMVGWPAYKTMGWMHAKLGLVVLLWIYHIVSGYYLVQFKHDRNTHSATFYRIFNEFPVLILIAVVILVEVQPF